MCMCTIIVIVLECNCKYMYVKKEMFDYDRYTVVVFTDNVMIPQDHTPCTHGSNCLLVV